jgi:nucleoid-associated protein YgaU
MTMYSDPAFRPLRWIGAVAVLGVVSAAIAVLAWEAVDDSFTFIGDGRAQSDAVILATGAPDSPGEDAAEDAASPPAQDDADETDDETGSDAADPPAAIYEVEAGDTGTSIARELFGRQDAWDDIAEYNDILPTETLSVGQVLRIPDL